MKTPLTNYNRNIGVDILKFLAVILITNSHMDMMYGKYGALATGGTIGDVLFFFCSGFTLFLKPLNGLKAFPNWYKRRINRIYPTVLAVAIIKCTFFDAHPDINRIILRGGGWFVSCIMVYYVFIFFIGSYWKKYVYHIMAAVGILSCVWFFYIERVFPFNMYGGQGGYLKWLLYFMFMLLGAKMGMDNHLGKKSPKYSLYFSFIGIVLFYVVYVSSRTYREIEWIQIFNFIPLLFAVYYLYHACNGRSFKKLYTTKTGNIITRFIGGLCLEVYLIQNPILTDKLNHIFPLNLLIIFCAILIAAYLTRCLARCISQTFKDEPYQWNKIIEPFN